MADSKCSSAKLAVIPCRRQKKKKERQSNLFNNLCDELVGEILLRLPTKSAIRSQVVYKRWYSLISSPYFISRFTHIRQSSLIFQVTYYRDRTEHYDFQIISESSLLRNLYGDGGFNSSVLTRNPPRNLELRASFADLMLCSRVTRTKKTIYYVINLLTRQWITLPLVPHFTEFMEHVSTGFLCVLPSCSQCKPVDSSHHKFMVVRLSSYDVLVSHSHFKVQVFSSEDRQWRTSVVSSSLPLEPNLWETALVALVAYRGMLHWLTVDCIAVYDPFNTPNTFSRIIHLPIQLPSRARRNICFGVSQGRLRVVEPVYPILHVWELEDYDSGLWNLVYEVHFKTLIRNGFLESVETELICFSVCLHPENEDVIYLQMYNGVVHVNMKSRTIECYYPIENIAMSSCTNAFHVADQWWPTPVSSLLR